MVVLPLQVAREADRRIDAALRTEDPQQAVQLLRVNCQRPQHAVEIQGILQGALELDGRGCIRNREINAVGTGDIPHGVEGLRLGRQFGLQIIVGAVHGDGHGPVGAAGADLEVVQRHAQPIATGGAKADIAAAQRQIDQRRKLRAGRNTVRWRRRTGSPIFQLPVPSASRSSTTTGLTISSFSNLMAPSKSDQGSISAVTLSIRTMSGELPQAALARRKSRNSRDKGLPQPTRRVPMVTRAVERAAGVFLDPRPQIGRNEQQDSAGKQQDNGAQKSKDPDGQTPMGRAEAPILGRGWGNGAERQDRSGGGRRKRRSRLRWAGRTHALNAHRQMFCAANAFR